MKCMCTMAGLYTFIYFRFTHVLYYMYFLILLIIGDKFDYRYTVYIIIVNLPTSIL